MLVPHMSQSLFKQSSDIDITTPTIHGNKKSEVSGLKALS
jgi:hypothetical protein